MRVLPMTLRNIWPRGAPMASTCRALCKPQAGPILAASGQCHHLGRCPTHKSEHTDLLISQFRQVGELGVLLLVLGNNKD